MRKILLNLIIIGFYAVGILQTIYNWSTLVSVIVGLCSAVFALYIDDKME